MAYNLKKIMVERDAKFSQGHRMCAGCGVPVVVQMILRAVKPKDHVVVANATGCLEVSSTIYPYTSWETSYIHTAFASASATLSGVEAALKKRKEEIKKNNQEMQDVKLIAFGGDGGTYDIGIQSLSAVMERGHDLTYVCYDNGGYMNTGIQRSSATPIFASTTTSPIGTQKLGKMESRKDLTSIMVAHNIPYVAQTAAYKNFKDLYEKSEKAIYTEGAKFINVFAPCPRGWGYSEELLMKINALAVETCYWPLYEVVNGVYKITYKPARKLPIEEFLRPQKRFKHLFKPENQHLIQIMQEEVDRRWNKLLLLEKMTNLETNTEI